MHHIGHCLTTTTTTTTNLLLYRLHKTAPLRTAPTLHATTLFGAAWCGAQCVIVQHGVVLNALFDAARCVATLVAATLDKKNIA